MDDNLFIFSNYYQIFKKYGIKHISDVEIINGLLGIIINTYQIKGRNDNTIYYEKSECSKIKNRNLDISANIRVFLNNDNIEQELLEEVEDFVNSYINVNFKNKIINEVSNLYWNDILISNDICKKLDKSKESFNIFISTTLVEVLKYNNLKNYRKKEIYYKGTTSVNLCVADILDNTFIKTIEKKSLLVIPTDTSFDTKISKPNDKNPHVSDKTLHGKWIIKMIQSGKTSEDLEKTIQNNLNDNKYECLSNKYPIGSVAVVDYKNIYYYLLALTDFNTNNKAIASINDLDNALNALLEYYDIYGQGYPLYIPLIGTGRSRLSLSHAESLRKIKGIIKGKINKIQGEINIVIYEKDLNKLEKEDINDL